MKISVVVPAFNEARNIRKSLGALAAQTLPHHEYEVVVVDNGSTDNTVAIARSFEGHLQVRVVTKVGGSIAAVRNFGADQANGQVIAFLDADCIPKANWLSHGLECGAENVMWGAHYLVPEDSTWVGKLWFAYQAKEQQGATSFIPASNLFAFKHVFDAMGGFSEQTETSEDVEISLRARKRGMRTLAFPELAVSHEGTPQTLRHFYRQNRWHGMHVLRVFLANLPSRDNAHLIAISLYTLVVFWCTIVALILGVLGVRSPWLLVPIALLAAPAALLTSVKTIRARRLADAPRLFVLYLTYLLARAAALTHVPKRRHR